jgi:hypothetical protein
MRLYVLPGRSSATSAPVQDRISLLATMPFGEAIPLIRGLGFAARRRKHVLPHPTSDAKKHLPNTSKSRDVDTEIEWMCLKRAEIQSVGGWTQRCKGPTA